MGKNAGDDVGFWSLLPWALLGGAAGYGIYALVKSKIKTQVASEPKPGTTVVAPVAPIAPPSRFADINSVEIRFGQVRELYRMGYLTPVQAIDELAGLSAAANTMITTGKADFDVATDIITRVDAFTKDVQDYLRLQQQGVGPGISGARLRLINGANGHAVRAR